MTDNVNSQQDSQVSAYGYDLLRHELLPELLGEDETMILYWAGKTLARKKMKELESICSEDFFIKANWGRLTLEKEKRQENLYELVSFHQQKDRPFSLETGFLAQLTEIQKGVISEASYSIKRKKPLTVSIIVRWDKKDSTHENPK